MVLLSIEFTHLKYFDTEYSFFKLSFSFSLSFTLTLSYYFHFHSRFLFHSYSYSYSYYHSQPLYLFLPLTSPFSPYTSINLFPIHSTLFYHHPHPNISFSPFLSILLSLLLPPTLSLLTTNLSLPFNTPIIRSRTHPHQAKLSELWEGPKKDTREIIYLMLFLNF
jgi:hypothetical protein